MEIPNLATVEAKLIGLAIFVVVLIGGIWYVYYKGGEAAKGKYVAASQKSTASVKANLDKAAVKLEAKYTARSAYREGVKDYFEQEIQAHEEKQDEAKAAGTAATGISDDGVRLINSAIACRDSESKPTGLGTVPQTAESERGRGREGCTLVGK